MVKTTFSKQITEKIVEHWGLGFTAEESHKALLDNGIKISLHTVYNHRRSLTAQQLIDELIRRQERAILKADAEHPELAMKYRNELLKVLVPQRIEADIQSTNREIRIVASWDNKYVEQPQTDTSPTQDNLNSIQTMPDSGFLRAEDGGVKITVPYTKQSTGASQEKPSSGG